MTLPYARAFQFSLIMGFTLLFLIFYGGSSYAMSWLALPKHHIAWAFERNLPLMPAWSWVYITMPVVLIGVSVRLTWQRQWLLFQTLVWQLGMACVCFWLFPVQLDFPPVQTDDWSLAIAHQMGMQHNYLPSLHCAFACTAALMMGRKWVLWLWAMAVCFSTWAIHAHHLWDIVAGVVLAVISYRILQARTQDADTLANVRLRWLLWVNQIRFTYRHRRYGLISLILLVQYGRNRPRGRRLIIGYCLLQAYDDVMDGDRTYPVSPDIFARQLIQAWQHQRFQSDDELHILAQALSVQLQTLADASAAYDDIEQLLRLMYVDYQRAQSHQLLTQTALQQQLHQTFYHSLNILFRTLESPTRADQISELVHALSWCSVVRDWDDDLAAGIINIPAEQWQQTDFPPPSPTQPANGYALAQHPAIRAWQQAQRIATQQQLAQLNQRLQAQPLDPIGERIVRLFARSVAKFVHSLKSVQAA